VILKKSYQDALEEPNAMTVDPSIDLAAVMTEHLETAEPDLLRELLRTFVQAPMSADAHAACGAPYGTSPERTTSRNGYRSRGWDTRVGSIELAVPKLRQGRISPSGCWSAAGGRRRRW
jgi:putative transposase